MTGEDAEGFADLCPELNLEELTSDPEAPRQQDTLPGTNMEVESLLLFVEEHGLPRHLFPLPCYFQGIAYFISY